MPSASPVDSAASMSLVLRRRLLMWSLERQLALRPIRSVQDSQRLLRICRHCQRNTSVEALRLGSDLSAALAQILIEGKRVLSRVMNHDHITACLGEPS